jgi:hypothetical protein
MEAAFTRLDEVESRLRSVISLIVKRHIERGESLSWRLLFDIEDEAVALLERDADLDRTSIRMLTGTPPAPRDCRTEQLVRLAELHAMHTVLWMILEAYCRSD